MRPLWALLIYFVVIFIGGALLAPWLYELAQHLPFPKIANSPFHRFEDRAFLILALAGIWPLLKAFGAKSPEDLGITPPYGQARKFLGGLLLGFFSLALVAALAIGFRERAFVPDLTTGKIIKTVFSAIGTAAVVSVLEEILFRGGLFGGLRRFLWWPFALLTSSLIFAFSHFLQRGEITGQINWHSGLDLLPQMFAGFADLRAFIPKFFSLTLVGILLCLGYQRTGNLYFSIGLHGGWIFWLKVYASLTYAFPRNITWFWGSEKMVDGWLAFFILVIALAIFRFLPLAERRLRYTIAE
ncbi:MAG TPA: CPBP family intramembrane glutamic endopeptidase [Verrucomicrobiae bacterium]|nr:CPBP family intramembrane glutamic endopeptidase [Verrucomicrobiae bacterium]